MIASTDNPAGIFHDDLIAPFRRDRLVRLVEAIMFDPDCFTKHTGRLNKSALAKKLRWRRSKLEAALARCREIMEAQGVELSAA